MASLRVLAFDHEGRPIQFDTWLHDLQLYLLSNSRDSVSLFDHTSGAAPAPPATSYSVTCSQWLTRDAVARLAIRNHLPLAECAHFGQHRTAQALYDAVAACYSSLATAALGRLLLPYLFPELSAFAIAENLVSHLRTSDARYRATLPPEFLAKNPPPIDHFLTLDPTALTVDLLEQHLLAAETSVVAVGAARGTPRTPFVEGCSPSPLAPSNTSAAAAGVPGAEDVGAASASAKRRSSKGKGGRGGGGGSGGGGRGSSGGGGGNGSGGSGGSGGGSGGFGGGGGGSGGSGGSGSGGSGGGRTGAQCEGSGGGQRQQQQRRSETPSPQQLREWFAQRGVSGGSGSCPYVIRMGHRADQICGNFHTQHRCFSRPNDAWRAEFGDESERRCWTELLRSGIAIFDLDYDAILAAVYALSVSAEGDCYLCVLPDPSIEAAALGASDTTLPPLSAPVPVRLADPSRGPTPCPFLNCSPVSGGSVRLTVRPSPPLVLYELGEYRCPLGRDGHYHHSWGSLPPLQPSPAPPCLPCVEGRQRAAPHSSSFPLTTAPLQNLHMDVWGPGRVSGQSRERYFLLVIEDYTRYTTVFPLQSKGQVVDVLIPWICAVLLQLREQFRTDLPVLRLHSDRGGEFSSDLLRDFCRGEGILQSFTLLDSPQQNGIAERRIGLVMEVARISMIHATAPHFLWPFAVRYVARQLNLWPRVSLPEISPTQRWTGKVGDASVFRVWGSHAFVCDTSADKLSARTIPCVFLGFSPDAPGRLFYHPTSRRVLPSQDVTFDESVPFYCLFPATLPCSRSPSGRPPTAPGSCSLRCVSGRPSPWYCDG
ncbi:unnamed protein product [Closterium sp. NIES-53]